jgi:hypothetical protein
VILAILVGNAIGFACGYRCGKREITMKIPVEISKEDVEALTDWPALPDVVAGDITVNRIVRDIIRQSKGKKKPLTDELINKTH